MTWSYSGDPADDDLNATRFLIGDTDSSDQLVSDEEIEFLISSEDSVYLAAATALEALSSKFARENSISGDGLSVSAQRSQAFQQRAVELRKQDKRVRRKGGLPEFTGAKRTRPKDSEYQPHVFGEEMHDIPGGSDEDDLLSNQ